MNEDFFAQLAVLLKAQPGLSRARIAAAMSREPDAELRELLDQACEKEVANKTLDKYYPGPRNAY